MAFIAEQAGGLALTDKQRVLEVQPTDLHQRVPFFVGSKQMVEKAISFVKNK
jgi:fructose-1,6-bisphosphatase I